MANEKVLNIYQRLDQARVEIGIVQKTVSVMNNYKAVSETDILKAVNEAEHKVGLYSFLESLDILKSIQQNGFNFIRVRVGVRIVNIDKPEESLIFYGLGDGLDKGDKACGKAVTYAMKYALMKGFKIPSGEDSDYFKNEEIKLEPLASEEQVQLYTSLVGVENIPHICKKLGVKDLHDLTSARIQKGIEVRQKQLGQETINQLLNNGDNNE